MLHVRAHLLVCVCSNRGLMNGKKNEMDHKQGFLDTGEGGKGAQVSEYPDLRNLPSFTQNNTLLSLLCS